MTNWDERFRKGSYPDDPDPSRILSGYIHEIPTGRALDVATGTGRNAVFLASEGYTVDAIDSSRVGLEIVSENAAERGVKHRVNCIQGDVDTYGFPSNLYDLVTISFFRTIHRLTDVVEALAPGGYLFVQHHLRSTDPTPSGPSDDRFRYGANELLRASLGLTVLYYDESTWERPGDKRRANVTMLARNTAGTRQSYPRRWDEAPSDGTDGGCPPPITRLTNRKHR